MTTHGLRHSTASILLAEGVDPMVIRQIREEHAVSDPNISAGNMSPKPIPPGGAFTTLTTLDPAEGRTVITGQFAITMPSKLVQRATVVEVQLVRLLPGGGLDPTGQDDRAMAIDVDLATGKVLRVRQRQNWTYHDALRTHANVPLRVEARHNGPVTINLEWVVKAVLVRPEASE